MKRRTKAYLDGFATVQSVLDLDHVTAREVLESLGGPREMDFALSPWKRGCREAIRNALRS